MCRLSIKYCFFFLVNKHKKAFYLAPENFKDICTFASDIWSCGVIFHLLLLGFPPFNGKTQEEILEKVKGGKIDYENEAFKEISEDAKNLLKNLLEYDSNKRISAEQALAHKYFNENTSSVSNLNLNYQNRIKNLDNFQVFIIYSFFYKY